MNRKQRWGMLLFLVGLPYVRTKAQQCFERLRAEEQDELGQSSSPERGLGQVSGFHLGAQDRVQQLMFVW